MQNINYLINRHSLPCKIFYSIALILFLLTLCCVLSCDDDEDDEDTKTIASILKTEKNYVRIDRIIVVFFSLADNCPSDMDAKTCATPLQYNTKTLAYTIANNLGCKIYEIKLEKQYPIPATFKEMEKIAQDELNNPTILHISNDLEDTLNFAYYEVVILGYPLWLGREPLAIDSFILKHNFKNKAIIPFCTSLSTDIEKSEDSIKRYCNGDKFLTGKRFPTAKKDAQDEAITWIRRILNNIKY